MSLNRRELLAGFGGLALLGVRAGADAGGPRSRAPAPGLMAPGFPRKADFGIPEGTTYLNCAYTHPMPLGAVAAVRAYLERRAQPGADLPAEEDVDPKAEFAALINAKPSEISYVTSTSAGENLIVAGLGLPRSGGNVVTDSLHFEGALVHLGELRQRGLEVRTAMAHDGRVELRDLEGLIDRHTRLVEISLVAMYNGFQHDLKAVCDLAHAHGAYVYADIVQAAGAVPIDVRASGVDFCACSSFKWLMGDFGGGFLYVREELLDRFTPRTDISYHSTSEMESHFPPFDPAADTPVTWTMRDDATGHFETGSTAHAAEAALRFSLPYLRRLEVESIQAYRQPMLRRIREGMTRLGYRPATPEGTTSPLITFATRDGRPAADKLKKARVDVRVSRYWIRFSPSVFNDMDDVERALEALA